MINRHLAQLVIILLLSLLHELAYSQSSLTTQPLTVTATCPGSTISIPFTLPSGVFTTANTIYTVQLATGGAYFDIPTGQRNYGGSITVTLPKSIALGVSYSVRVTTTSPDYIGTPSPTKLFMKGSEARPPRPLVDSLNVDCMSTNQSSMSGLYADITFRLVEGATPRLYYDQTRTNYSEYAEFPYSTKLPTGEYVRDLQYGYFQLNKTSRTSPTYVYPVSESTYYISQRIDGCESEPVASKLRIIWKASGGPGLLNPLPNNPTFGRLTYCQGEQAYPLNVNGHKPPPENFQVTYGVGGFQSIIPGSLIPPIPSTQTIGSTSYVLNLVPIDYSKGCENQNYLTFNYLTVTVNPIPTKPTATTGLIEYYQGQPSTPLSASATDSLATLVWYGTQATGGTGSAIAPQPVTNQSGEFTYYVAQKVGRCEGERTAITIRINPLLALDDTWLGAHSAVYPNPVASRLTVQVGGVSAQQPTSLEVMDLTGKPLQKSISQKETSELNLESYLAGSYLLVIRVGNQQTMKRIVKQ